MNRLNFLLLYGLALPLTYVLPYFGSNSLLATIGTGGLTLIGTLVHLLCFGVMIIAAVTRGPVIGKSALWAFPVIALIFDFVPLLSAIPFVPTVMHVIALVIGLANEEVSNQNKA